MHEPDPARQRPTPSQLARWYREGARTACFLPARWQGLRASPLMAASLTLAGVLLWLGLERLRVAGPARFYWPSLTEGWLATAALAWVAYLLRPRADGDEPGAAQLVCLLFAQSQVVVLLWGLPWTLVGAAGIPVYRWLGPWSAWAAWLVPGVWIVGAQWVLLWRSGGRRPTARQGVAAALVAGVMALSYLAPGAEPWYAEVPADADGAPAFALTQELMEVQPAVLARRLQEVPAQRPGRVDVYAVSFAPYAGEDVFRRESEMVLSVMQQRFDARGAGVQLLNHRETAGEWPWATPLNLRRVLQHLAGVMDREEDVLFLHLTSHGARDGELAVDFWPMTVAPVMPAELKAWLDESGIRHRVISVSACYSGSWLAPLADEHTLVMTAADADHTSYGCGRLSELTFFGRAMYDEQLRRHTLSFEQAHATAREVIRQREQEAGKDDGYSNPQLHMGASIRTQLARLHGELTARR